MRAINIWIALAVYSSHIFPIEGVPFPQVVKQWSPNGNVSPWNIPYELFIDDVMMECIYDYLGIQIRVSAIRCICSLLPKAMLKLESQICRRTTGRVPQTELDGTTQWTIVPRSTVERCRLVGRSSRGVCWQPIDPRVVRRRGHVSRVMERRFAGEPRRLEHLETTTTNLKPSPTFTGPRMLAITSCRCLQRSPRRQAVLRVAAEVQS